MSPFGRCLSFPSPSPNLDPHPGWSAKKPRPVQNVKYPQPPFFFLRQPPFSFLTTHHLFFFDNPLLHPITTPCLRTTQPPVTSRAATSPNTAMSAQSTNVHSSGPQQATRGSVTTTVNFTPALRA